MSKLALIPFLMSGLLCAQVAAQATQQAAATDATKLATVEGQVFNLVTKEAVKRVDVQMFRTGKGSAGMAAMMQAAYSATTDAEGRFKIENVEAGEYRINYRKAGFLGGGRGGIRDDIGAGIADGNGEGGRDARRAEGLPDAAGHRRRARPGRRGRARAGGDGDADALDVFAGHEAAEARGRETTNDRGEYRISNVPPGPVFHPGQLVPRRGTRRRRWAACGWRTCRLTIRMPRDPAQATRSR